MIHVEALRKAYGSNQVLEGATFAVEGGELVLLLGGNGAGKSTLLRCLLGLEPYEGTIRIAGLDPLREGREVRRNVGYMPQGAALHLDLTVRETLRFYAELRGTTLERAHRLLDTVELTDQLDTAVGALSGGMRQRLQLALALLDDPRVLLLDEPTASLDERSRELLVARLAALVREGRTILVSTHGHRDLAAVATRSIVLEAGRARAVPATRAEVDHGAPDPDATDETRRAQAGAPSRVPRSRGHVIAAIVRKELRDALRSRWLVGYAGLLAALGLVAAWAGLRSSEGMALATYGRTAATVTNLCLFLAPLASLVLGANTIAGERDRGTLEYLLAQPIERRELLSGKYLSLLIALAGATLAGFAPAAAVIAARAGWEPFVHFLIFPALACLLVTTLLAGGLVVSVRARSGVAALGFAVFTWFACVLAYDLVLLGVLVGAGIGPAPLALLVVANPVDAGRILVVLALEPDLYLLGPAGAWLLTKLGGTGAAMLLVGSLLGWAGVALTVAMGWFRAPRPVDGPHRRSLLSPRFSIDPHASNTEMRES